MEEKLSDLEIQDLYNQLRIVELGSNTVIEKHTDNLNNNSQRIDF